MLTITAYKNSFEADSSNRHELRLGSWPVFIIWHVFGWDFVSGDSGLLEAGRAALSPEFLSAAFDILHNMPQAWH